MTSVLKANKDGTSCNFQRLYSIRTNNTLKSKCFVNKYCGCGSNVKTALSHTTSDMFSRHTVGAVATSNDVIPHNY